MTHRMSEQMKRNVQMKLRVERMSKNHTTSRKSASPGRGRLLSMESEDHVDDFVLV